MILLRDKENNIIDHEEKEVEIENMEVYLYSLSSHLSNSIIWILIFLKLFHLEALYPCINQLKVF